MPSATDVIRLMLDEEVRYAPHSCPRTSLCRSQLGYELVTNQPKGLNTVNTPVTGLRKTVRVDGLAYLGVGVAKSFGMPIWYQCRYYGWDATRLTEILETAFTKLRAEPKMRFW